MRFLSVLLKAVLATSLVATQGFVTQTQAASVTVSGTSIEGGGVAPSIVLAADPGYIFSGVVSASFGVDGNACTNTGDFTQYVQGLCVGQSACIIPINLNIPNVGDPCPGLGKIARVTLRQGLSANDAIYKSYGIISASSSSPFQKILSFQDDSANAFLGPASYNPIGFHVENTQDGFQYIINQLNDYCLQGGTTSDPVSQAPCVPGQQSQQWKLTNVQGASVIIQNRQSGLVLTNAGNIVLYTQNNPVDASQLWVFQESIPFTDSIGCFADNGSNRAFRKLMLISNSMTLERCGNLAIVNGFEYFGVENSTDCYGTDAGYDYYGPSSDCNMACSGSSSSQTCGGTLALSAYIVYPQYTEYCSPVHGCLAHNNEWCANDQNLIGCMNDRAGDGAADGTWCRGDQNWQGCLNDHGGIGSRAIDGTWCRSDGNTRGCLLEHDHIPFPKEYGVLVKLINDAHSCGTHYTVYRESCSTGSHICSGDLTPRGQVGDTAKCHYDIPLPVNMCIRFEQQIGGDCQVSDTQTTVSYLYSYGHFSGHNAWAS